MMNNTSKLSFNVGDNHYEVEVAVTHFSMESDADGIISIGLEGISSPNGITIINDSQQEKKPDTMEILTEFQKEIGNPLTRKVVL